MVTSILDLLHAIDRQALSDFAGSASFIVWLFAQSPQLWENYQRSSVDGLSPIFLLQWFLGDALNLIGCLLTHQLPFQIAVATYFCFVDTCISAQFYYYWRRDQLLAAQDPYRAHSRLRSHNLSSSGLLARPHKRSHTLPYSRRLVSEQASDALSSPRTTRTREPSHSPSWGYHSWRAGSVASSRKSRRNEGDAEAQETHANTDYFDLVPSPRKRAPIPHYAPELSHTHSYQALANAAMSVAELAEEAVARRRQSQRHSVHLPSDPSTSSRQSALLRSLSREHQSRSRPPIDRHRTSASQHRQRTWDGELVSDEDRVHAKKYFEASSREGKGRKTRSGASRNAVGQSSYAYTSRSSASGASSRHTWGSSSVGQLPPRAEARSAQLQSSIASLPKRRKGGNAADRASSSSASSRRTSESSVKEAALANASSDAVDLPNSDADSEARGRDMTRTAGRFDSLVASRMRLSQGGRSETSPCPSDFTQMPGLDLRIQAASESPSASGTVMGDPEPQHLATYAPQRDRSLGRHLLRSRTGVPNPSPDAARRGSGMVLLAVFGFFSLGGWGDSTGGIVAVEKPDTGRVLGVVMGTSSIWNQSARQREADAAWTDVRHPAMLYPSSGPFSSTRVNGTSKMVDLVWTPLSKDLSRHGEHPQPPHPSPPPPAPAPPPPPTWDRLIGRISSWTCTVLYMTSRLPQIWTNAQRRSVAGLSILLFISAFMGNALYTVSILANPRSTGEGSAEYLKESTPFLLGSGGTLVFDLIIVLQWWAWRERGGKGERGGGAQGEEAPLLRERQRETSHGTTRTRINSGDARPPLRTHHSRSMSRTPALRRQESQTSSKSSAAVVAAEGSA